MGGLTRGKTVYLWGPVTICELDRVARREYFRQYFPVQDAEPEIPFCYFGQLLAWVSVLAGILLNKQFLPEELIADNHLKERTVQELKVAQTRYALKNVDDVRYHHTYEEERQLLDCVRRGDVTGALSQTMKMDQEMGRLSQKASTHWKDVVVVAVTLCTRAAIEGGVSAGVAYQLSDYYIDHSDRYQKISELIVWRNTAVSDFTKHVELAQNRNGSNYIAQFQDYVRRHYQEKVYLHDIAQALGLSPTYLSRIVSTQLGLTFQDYVVQYRVSQAAELCRAARYSGAQYSK